MVKKALVVIPARLDSMRLPQKALADIQGKPMIVRVWEQAIKANIGPVIVACCGPEIRQVVEAAGGRAIETDPALPSGTDRVHAAVEILDPQGDFEYVINLQGDLPTINPTDVAHVMVPLENPSVDVGTLGCVIKEEREIYSPHVVKIAAGHWEPRGAVKVSRALYFSRNPIPANGQTFYHHIGIYGFKREALRKFVSLKPSYLECTEKLEHLRALEAGMRIDVALVEEIPPSVDTAEDLKRVVSTFHKE